MPRSKRRRTTSKRWRTFLFPFEGVFYTRVSFYAVSSYSDCCPYTHIQNKTKKIKRNEKKRNTEKKRREILHSAALAVVFRLKPKRIETLATKTNQVKQKARKNSRTYIQDISYQGYFGSQSSFVSGFRSCFVAGWQSHRSKLSLLMATFLARKRVINLETTISNWIRKSPSIFPLLLPFFLSRLSRLLGSGMGEPITPSIHRQQYWKQTIEEEEDEEQKVRVALVRGIG